jgi:hypothetical protein
MTHVICGVALAVLCWNPSPIRAAAGAQSNKVRGQQTPASSAARSRKLPARVPAKRGKTVATSKKPAVTGPTGIEMISPVDVETYSGSVDISPASPSSREPSAIPEPSLITPLPQVTLPHSTRGSVGLLRLDVIPKSADVYVDGFYAGTAGNSPATGIRLPSGWHRVELRAPGYETAAINVTVVPMRTIDSRADLKPVR